VVKLSEDDLNTLHDAKQLTVAEFVDLGILQEINRRLLNPRGLMMYVVLDMTDHRGVEADFGVYDFRDDPEGCMIPDFSQEHADIFDGLLHKVD
jgi:hypothetical protein